MPEAIRLYRFLSAASALRTLEGKMFRVGRVAEFNDPFEWKLGFTNYVPEGEIIARQVQEHLLRQMNSQFGVICFSDTAEDPVLWSHYADHHRGMALAVDHWVTDQLHKVVYSDDRPTLDLNRIDAEDVDVYASMVLKGLLGHKSSGWGYEREYRVFADLATCTVSDGSYFLPIPPHFLKKVILGFKCPVDEGYVRRSLDVSGFQDVAIVRATDSNHSYKIQY
jgi:hypothetical protein